MRERPILFSAPMVRAILNGTKTQTRRVAKPRRKPSLLDGSWSDAYVLGEGNRDWLMKDNPYGVPGDRLWVKETHAIRSTGQVVYRADTTYFDPRAADVVGGSWRPSIHMTRSASRLTLTITDVRVERLQDISEDDARAEGCPFDHNGTQYEPPANDPWQGYGRASFSLLWSKINGAASWDANPWVWVVSFSRAKEGS